MAFYYDLRFTDLLFTVYDLPFATYDFIDTSSTLSSTKKGGNPRTSSLSQ